MGSMQTGTFSKFHNPEESNHWHGSLAGFKSYATFYIPFDIQVQACHIMVTYIY